MMKHLLLGLALASTAACSKKGAPSCNDVFEHTKSLLPAEMAGKLDSTKDAALAKCEKASDESKKCAMDASTLEDLQKCPRT